MIGYSIKPGITINKGIFVISKKPIRTAIDKIIKIDVETLKPIITPSNKLKGSMKTRIKKVTIINIVIKTIPMIISIKKPFLMRFFSSIHIHFKACL